MLWIANFNLYNDIIQKILILKIGLILTLQFQHTSALKFDSTNHKTNRSSRRKSQGKPTNGTALSVTLPREITKPMKFLAPCSRTTKQNSYVVSALLRLTINNVYCKFVLLIISTIRNRINNNKTSETKSRLHQDSSFLFPLFLQRK